MNLETSFMINATLHELWTQENRIGDPGGQKLLGALGCNQAIEKVFLEYNQIGDDIVEAIQNVANGEERLSPDGAKFPLAQG